MKDNGKFNLGWYLFAGVMGILSGACFSKSMYHKGRVDAANEITENMYKVFDDFDKVLDEALDKEESE